MKLYDAKNDGQFSKGYIDIDEMRIRYLQDGTEISYRYLHGGFEETPVKFSFCYPQKDQYEGRFYQYLSPFPGPEEELASLPASGEDDKIAFCLTHGAYYVESNMGSGEVFTNSDDKTMSYRSSAASAEYSRVMAQKVYDYQHRPYGYVFGGSGGGYRTIACIENTNTFDGAIPYVIGSPYAIPNCQTTRAHAERILRHKIWKIIEAMEPGGSGDPYAGLNQEEREALREVTQFGYPLKSWFASANMDDGALPVLIPGVKSMDPQYFKDFWNVSGYLGADFKGSAQRDRICMDTTVRLVFTSEEESQMPEGMIDTRNGVNNAWKKMIQDYNTLEEPWLELTEVPVSDDLYTKGCKLTISSGKARGLQLQIERFEGNRVYFTEGFGMNDIHETLNLLKIGDVVHLDNSDYIAIQTYHRHQIPSSDYKAWDQFRDSEGKSLYPQQETLVGPVFCGNGPGCEQNGLVQGKIIIVAALMDEQAYPWQADWYRRKIESVHEGNVEQYCRLWYFDNTLHGDSEKDADNLHVVTYLAGLKQALIDLAAWVEKGIEPLPSSNYKIDVGCVKISESATERGGIQPVVHLTVNSNKCVHVKAGQGVCFHAKAEVPEGAGKLISMEWNFEGESIFEEINNMELSVDGNKESGKVMHTFDKPGIYFPVVRVKSERNGSRKNFFTQIKNIDRVKIIVE